MSGNTAQGRWALNGACKVNGKARRRLKKRGLEVRELGPFGGALSRWQETTAPRPSPPPELPGNCSSSARKQGTSGAPTNHHSQEALRRRNALAQLPLATASVLVLPFNRVRFEIAFAFYWRLVMTKRSLIGSASEAVV